MKANEKRRICHTPINHWLRNLGYVGVEFTLQITFWCFFCLISAQVLGFLCKVIEVDVLAQAADGGRSVYLFHAVSRTGHGLTDTRVTRLIYGWHGLLQGSQSFLHLNRTSICRPVIPSSVHGRVTWIPQELFGDQCTNFLQA